MLHLIENFDDQFFNLLKEDPVRPNIPHELRIGENKDVFVLKVDKNPEAVLCASYQSIIPQDESELFKANDSPEVAIFYTIWSYKPGSGRKLIIESVKFIKENKKEIKKFVTLSPKTEMARKFHLSNGASIFRTNNSSINYEYDSTSII